MPKGVITLADGVIAHGRGSFVIVPRDLRKLTRSKPLYDSSICPVPSSLLTALGVPATSQTIPAPTPEPEQDQPTEANPGLGSHEASYYTR
jgi:hypothetical protein